MFCGFKSHAMKASSLTFQSREKLQMVKFGSFEFGAENLEQFSWHSKQENIDDKSSVCWGYQKDNCKLI